MTRTEYLQDALTVPIPQSEALVLESCRRLLGPNLFSARTGAVGDALVKGFAPNEVAALWAFHALRLLDALGWREEQLFTRSNEAGTSLMLTAPEDQLFSAAYILECAWYFVACELLSLPTQRFSAMVESLQEIAGREANPEFTLLLAEARSRKVDCLLDDELVTFGHGNGACVLATETPPAVGAVGWSKVHNIPVALVTGTNGKTTTTRLIAAMGQAAGLMSGLSSTEFVKVGDEILDRGDYSGPAGARLLLRDKRVELAVLEVARGGILRRGLPISMARAAVVTNVAADHLGQYGINSVAELAQVKMSVHRALAPGGQLILNADDPNVVAAAKNLSAKPTWFSLSAGTAQIVEARAARRPCGWLDEGRITLFDGKREVALIDVVGVPLTLAGAARYNIENVLAAALAARALGVPDMAIRTVLASFRSDAKDNPGRANEFTWNGGRVFVDFAHNPHSIAAVTGALAALPANRRFVLISHAGDRSDQDIRDLASGAFALKPDYVAAAENPKYLRGRNPGEISGLIRQAALSLGMPADHVLMTATPADGAKAILERMQAGDLALLLVHSDRDEIFAMLESGRL